MVGVRGGGGCGRVEDGVCVVGRVVVCWMMWGVRRAARVRSSAVSEVYESQDRSIYVKRVVLV